MKKKKEYVPRPVYYTTQNPTQMCSLGESVVGEIMSGKEYSVNGKITSVHGDILLIDKDTGCCRTEKATIKSARGFGNVPSEAYECLRYWRKLGYRGSPFSYASFTREAYKRMKREKKIVSRCNASINNMLRNYFTGGWIECSTEGYCFEPVYHYDINKAYLSAAKKGLPSEMVPYNGDTSALGYVVIMEPYNYREGIPNFLSPFKDDPAILVTKDDVEEYGLKGKVKWGIQYYDLDVDLTSILRTLEHLPARIHKRCTQTFWGMFASYSGVDVTDMETREDYKLWNRNQNIAWASIIVRRVASQVYKAWKKYGGISCFVDSILCTDPITENVGSEIGGWKLEGFYEKGVYFKAAGVWHPLPWRSKAQIDNVASWYKHSGYKN